MREQVNELLTAVKEPNGDYRLCIDYRKLNTITVKDRYPLPNIEDLINKLGGYKYFCGLDMKQGYYQIPLTKDTIDKTTFITPDAAFQRWVNNIMSSLGHSEILVYLDDILLPSKSIKQGMEKLNAVLKICEENNLKLNLEK